MAAQTPLSTDVLQRGRELIRQRAWRDAFDALSAADVEASLSAEDLERLATAAYLIGKDAEGNELWARAHQSYVAQGDVAHAARCAFHLGFHLFHRGEQARGGGWLARARRLLDEHAADCVEQGYLLLPSALQSVRAGDYQAAHDTFTQAAQIGERFGDTDLVMFCRNGQGRTLIRLDKPAEGVALLDEAMVGITVGDVSPLLAGVVYCSTIEGCHEIFDLRRAQEWTAALTEWCAAQQGLAPYRGDCLVRRAEILQLHGAWPDAMEEIQRACEAISSVPGQYGAGGAFYRCGELYRLRGEFDKAEALYRQASHSGRTPEPGLAELRLAQGQVDAAESAIRRALDEAREPRTRSRLLAPFIEIMLAANDVASARAAADELSAMADDLNAPLLRALAEHATGSVLLAEGDARGALTALRHAWGAWQELEAPYEGARVRVLVARACRALGDDDGAEMELDAARQVFESLGAAPDLAMVKELSRRTAPRTAGPLTAREVQVLSLIAAGKTNRAIADELLISEKTVARHVSNIFTKLGLSSCSAATAYAYRQGILLGGSEARRLGG